MRTTIMAAIVGLLLAASTGAGEDRAPGPGVPGPHGDRRIERPDGRRGPAWRPMRQQEATARRGYVFFDGEFVPPPYELKQAGQDITLNGRVLHLDAASPSDSAGRFPSTPAPRSLTRDLEASRALVAFGDERAVLLSERATEELVRLLAVARPSERSLAPLLELLPAHADRPRWQAWLTAFVPPPALHEEAVARTQEVDQLLAEGEQAMAANRRLNTWAYPLTIFGMLASVVAFGHLLQFPPRGRSDLVPSRRRAELCRATVIFLAMVVILSGLDLVWTLLVSQTGQMQELNPIGQRLLGDPWLLSLFKGTATLASCGLLLMLRRHPRAQLASWWMCLVCTLLTFRWLVLNSMFVA